MTNDERLHASHRAISEIARFPEFVHEPGSVGYVEKLLLAQLLLITRPRLIVETGTFHGLTTRFIAGFIALNDLPECFIASFDLPAVIESLRGDPALTAHPSVHFIPGMLPGSLRTFLAERTELVDLAIVDADHSYRAVKEELEALHTKLRPGAYVFCHDYREGDPKYEGVVYAVDRFAEANGYDLLALNPVYDKGEEIVWGSVVLRRPRHAKSASARRALYYDIVDSARTRLERTLRRIR